MPSHTCPICKNQFTYESIERARHFPFCSRRCKLIDLGNWLDGRYAIPGSDEEDHTNREEEENE